MNSNPTKDQQLLSKITQIIQPAIVGVALTELQKWQITKLLALFENELVVITKEREKAKEPTWTLKTKRECDKKCGRYITTRNKTGLCTVCYKTAWQARTGYRAKWRERRKVK